MTRQTLLALATVLVLGLSGAVPGVNSASRDDAPTLMRTVVLDGLDAPWDLAFTPDGAMLVTEKCRGLSVRRADGTWHFLFGRNGAAVAAPDFFCQGQSGAHGVAVDPEFARTRFVYLYMPSTLVSPPTNRVVRLVVDPGYTTVSARTDIVPDIPFKHAANAVSGAGMHSGGRIHFGPDGFLYITTGDNHQPTLPQDLTRLGGKVLRVDRDGRPAPGNHTPAGGDPRIYTYGHRNVQDITFRPGTGQPFVAEHGPNHTDEVTPLVAGGNGGWDPQQRPQLRCPDDYCGYAGDATTMPMTDTTRFPEAMQPSWTNEGESEGMGPCTFLTGAQWGAWEGRLAVGFLAGQRVEVLDLDAAGMTTSHTRLDLPRQRIRALVPDPHGDLYIAVDAGAIWRVAPQATPDDYDGDGKTDFAVYRPSIGVWFILNSASFIQREQPWGLPGDIPVPGDYDGDGKTDFAVYRPSTGVWFILNSASFTRREQPWGLPGDIPVPGDYDGDGKTDLAVYRPSTGVWFILNSASFTQREQPWGLPGDQPLPGQF